MTCSVPCIIEGYIGVYIPTALNSFWHSTADGTQQPLALEMSVFFVTAGIGYFAVTATHLRALL